jgi:hypothetical protein
MSEACKKILKIVGIIAAIAAVATAVYLVVKRIREKNEIARANDVESFVSCSCLDDEPIVVETKPAE